MNKNGNLTLNNDLKQQFPYREHEYKIQANLVINII